MKSSTHFSKEVFMTRYAYSVIVLVLSIFFLAGGYQIALSEEGGMKDKALDAKITTSVKAHLAKDDRLKTLTQISVKTVDKTVTLTGTVPTQQEKDMAEKVASGVEH